MPKTTLGPPRHKGWHAQSIISHLPCNGTNIIFDIGLSRNDLGRMPRPPSSLGLHTMSHLTRQRPRLFPLTSSPFQKKFCLSLLIFLISHVGSGKTVAWYETSGVRTDVTNWALADLLMSFPFHPGSFPPTLSRRGM
jgi:hypothetical protein